MVGVIGKTRIEKCGCGLQIKGDGYCVSRSVCLYEGDLEDGDIFTEDLFTVMNSMTVEERNGVKILRPVIEESADARVFVIIADYNYLELNGHLDTAHRGVFELESGSLMVVNRYASWTRTTTINLYVASIKKDVCMTSDYEEVKMFFASYGLTMPEEE